MIEKNKVTIDIISEGPYDVQKVWDRARKNSAGKSWLKFLVVKDYNSENAQAEGYRSMIDLSFGEKSTSFVLNPADYDSTGKYFAKNQKETPEGILLCDIDALRDTVEMRAMKKIFEQVNLKDFVNEISRDPSYINARAFQMDPSITVFKEVHRLDNFHKRYGMEHGRFGEFGIKFNYSQIDK